METPDDLAAALDTDPDARTAYRKLPPSHRPEYLEWINEAKLPETRQRRIDQATGMLGADMLPYAGK